MRHEEVKRGLRELSLGLSQPGKESRKHLLHVILTHKFTGAGFIGRASRTLPGLDEVFEAAIVVCGGEDCDQVF